MQEKYYYFKLEKMKMKLLNPIEFLKEWSKESEGQFPSMGGFIGQFAIQKS